MVQLKTVLETVDLLALEKGEKKNGYYRVKITTGELLKAFNLKPSTPHHRHIKAVVETHYSGTTAEAMGYGDGSSGFILHIKIWSK
jgi:hypothetical protein